METQQLKSKRRLEKLPQQDKKVNKSLILGTFVATFIAITPYLFYLYESVPSAKVWDTFLFTYESKIWEDVNYAMWVLAGKLIPLLLLIVWFFTNRHWWYHALLVPIIMYLYQIVVMWNEDTMYMDQFEILNFLPVMAIVIPSVYLIRARIFNKLNSVDKSMQDLEDELKIQPKGFWSSVKQYF